MPERALRFVLRLLSETKKREIRIQKSVLLRVGRANRKRNQVHSIRRDSKLIGLVGLMAQKLDLKNRTLIEHFGSAGRDAKFGRSGRSLDSVRFLPHTRCSSTATGLLGRQAESS